MISLKRKQSGFTIVELLIVIVVIGILAALVVTTFSGIQKKARDSERQTDINALHGQIEAYYASNGYYPEVGDITNATFRSANMKGLDASALTAPGSATNPDANASTTSKYQYNPTKADDSACDNGTAGDECVKYVLSADLENSGTNYTKNSLN